MGTRGDGAARRAGNWTLAVARTLARHLTAALIAAGCFLSVGNISAMMPEIPARRPLDSDPTPCAPLTEHEERAWAALCASLKHTPRTD